MEKRALQIVVLDGKTLNPGDLSWDALGEFGTLSVYDRTPPELVAWRLKGADIVFVNKTRLDAEQLASAKNLKFIGVLATGYDVVDVKAARALGIPVCNVPAYSSDAVAQLSFALLLELLSRVGHHSALVKRGFWSGCPDFSCWDIAPREAAGLTLGIIGCGRIGQRVALMGNAFNMRVIGCAPRPKEGFCGEFVGFEQLLRESDVISLHCPATPDTVGLINRETIALMKDGAMIINTARGTLLNEQDVADALHSGKLGGVGVDVVSKEPISTRNPLLSCPNCYITPHFGWAPPSARKRLMDITVANLAAFLAGQAQNVVN